MSGSAGLHPLSKKKHESAVLVSVLASSYLACADPAVGLVVLIGEITEINV